MGNRNSDSTTGSTEVFVALTGQRDNIGDSLLRRGLLKATPEGSARHVLIGPDSEDYATGLGLAKTDKTYVDRRRWMATLVTTAVQRRVILVMNAGEITPDTAFARARLLTLPVIWLVKLRGGAVIQAGLSVREPSARTSKLVRCLLTHADITAWRDEATRAWAGRGTVIPDWGITQGPDVATVMERHGIARTRRIVLSLRGDRPEPSEAVMGELRTALAATGAKLVVVCQVRRDLERSTWLAQELGGELVPWPADRSHREQEDLLRAEYARATWVISDRLHVVLAAMTEGAFPLSVKTIVSLKVARTLSNIDVIPAAPQHAEKQIIHSRRSLYDAIGSARERLQDVAQRISAHVEGRRLPRQQVVLHSMAGPDSTTRYATHMAATEDLNVVPQFFTWRRALFGSYDLFHLHWPEHLVRDGGTMAAQSRRLLAKLLVARLERRRVPVVRTLHNVTPHDKLNVDGDVGQLRHRFGDLTRLEVHLVDGDPRRDEVNTVLIPHGSYREPYALHHVPERVPGRVLFFGMLKPYKGVPELLEAFSVSQGGDLRIVGAPVDEGIVDLIEKAAAADSRVTAKFGFIPDDALANEIGKAELVALPYQELHSSGVVLVALSLCRPIIVPRSPTTEALLQEVGSEWVRLYDGSLQAEDLSSAQDWAALTPMMPPPNLAGRSWAAIRARHAEAYATLRPRHDSFSQAANPISRPSVLTGVSGNVRPRH